MSASGDTRSLSKKRQKKCRVSSVTWPATASSCRGRAGLRLAGRSDEASVPHPPASHLRADDLRDIAGDAFRIVLEYQVGEHFLERVADKRLAQVFHRVVRND